MSGLRLAFVDTSAWFALKDQADLDHEKAIDFLTIWDGDLVTSNFVIDETITLTLYKLGHQAAAELGESLWSKQYANIIHLSRDDERMAWELFNRYHDKEFSFTDCTSFAVMERLGLLHAFSFDEHFEQVGRFIRLPA